ncbi:MAG: cytochrome c biogenesis protein CcsA [Bacteroidales bacterium]|nr:cytochrome c biogenesis protein CcsA [Bacteroidales bacterium]
MKKISDFLFSMRLTFIIIVTFAVSIAAATFIESKYGTASARVAVYNAKWFEALLLFGIINLTGTVFRRKLYRKEKTTIFLFHIAFVIMIIGAGITRYFGFEGTMAIREGESSGVFLTEEAWLQITAGDDKDKTIREDQVLFTVNGRNQYNRMVSYKGQDIYIRCNEFVPDAADMIVADPNGLPAAEFIYSVAGDPTYIVIAAHEKKFIGSQLFTFDTNSVDTSVVRLIPTDDGLFFQAPFVVHRSNMANGSHRVLDPDSSYRFESMNVYDFRNNMLVLNTFMQKAKISLQSSQTNQGVKTDAINLEISIGNVRKELTIRGRPGSPGNPQTITIEQIPITISYGSIYKNLPFELKLEDFIIERYPGSNSPSWFESQVYVIDNENEGSGLQRIYMNNVLAYEGYRFYQSSYDADEKGTILTVNHDPVGTAVTYSGYMIMGFGMILSLFNRKSRFRYLAAHNKALKQGKKAIISILAILTLSLAADGQTGSSQQDLHGIDPDHARLFGTLLVQDNGGRIEPVNTLTTDVLHKIYRKNEYRGMSSDQVFLSMFTDPGTWQHEPLIRVPHKQIQEIMGNRGRHYAFSDFFIDSKYILQEYVEEAYRKIPAYRSKFDSEMIRLDERINIAYLVFTGDLLRVLPVPGDPADKWFSYTDIQGMMVSADSFYMENLIPLYIQSVRESLRSGNWEHANDLLKNLKDLQQRYASSEILPGVRQVSVEIFMNQTDVFNRISYVYAVVGFILLLLQFAGIFFSGMKLKVTFLISTAIIIIAFAAHTFGLVMRWYVSGHAPWSNGYEVLVYIAWITILAGLIFSGRSSVTLSTTSILAFLILNTAHLSWMDPQITNLVPVLKSHWLVIHVATITASYGFLGLGALLGFIDLVLMVFQTKRNYIPVETTLRELSNITEMSLIAGLYLLAAGTFLGGVWANESWGRYWGWDPKETWTLVTILAYAFIVHMRLIPGLKGLYSLNVAALLGLSTVIMTYFGVNYYLSGLHSYATGDPVPVPSFVIYTFGIVMLVAVSALINRHRLEKIKCNDNILKKQNSIKG